MDRQIDIVSLEDEPLAGVTVVAAAAIPSTGAELVVAEPPTFVPAPVAVDRSLTPKPPKRRAGKALSRSERKKRQRRLEQALAQYHRKAR